MWHLSMHGTTDHLDRDAAEEIEDHLVERLREVFAELVPDGHLGVMGRFEHTSKGAVNLADPGPDKPPAEPTAEPQGEVAVGQAPDVVMPSGEIANPTQPEASSAG